MSSMIKNANKGNSPKGGESNEPTPDQNENLQQNLQAEPEEKFYEYALIGGADHLTVHLGGESVETEGKVLRVNEAQNKELLMLMGKHRRIDLSSQLRLIDTTEAERVAREFLANQRRSAIKGPNSTMARHALEEQLAKNDGGERLRNLDVVESDIMHGNDGDGPLANSKQ